mgnify:CR=1 FL=1
MPSLPLSILDLSPVTTGISGPQALRNSIDLARHVDGLGYVRYWLAEHHNLASVASPAPDLMIGQIAAVTQHIRVGSGGVMLPNHAPLVVAERFKMLEALFPGRIDLGLGRAPGTDGATAYALRSRLDRREGDDFLERLHELTLWETRDFPAGHPYHNVVAMPDDSPLPPIWLLGSSHFSAHLAGMLGLLFAARGLGIWGILGVLGLGMGLIVISRGIDLSEVAIMAGSWAIALIYMQNGMPVFTAVLLALAIAVLIGVVNGVMVAFVEAPALFVTLAAGFVIYGLAFWIAPAWVVYAPKDAPGLMYLGAGRLFGIPVPILVFAACAIAMHLFLSRT